MTQKAGKLFVPRKHYPQPPTDIDPKLSQYLRQVVDTMRTNDLSMERQLNRHDQSVRITGGDTTLTRNVWTQITSFDPTTSAYRDSGGIFQPASDSFLIPYAGRYVAIFSGYFTLSYTLGLGTYGDGTYEELYGVRIRYSADAGIPEQKVHIKTLGGFWQPRLTISRIIEAETNGGIVTAEAIFTDSGIVGITGKFVPDEFSMYLIGSPTTGVQ